MQTFGLQLNRIARASIWSSKMNNIFLLLVAAVIITSQCDSTLAHGKRRKLDFIDKAALHKSHPRNLHQNDLPTKNIIDERTERTPKADNPVDFNDERRKKRALPPQKETLQYPWLESMAPLLQFKEPVHERVDLRKKRALPAKN